MPELMVLNTSGPGDREKFQGRGEHTVLRSPENGGGWGPLRDGSEGEAGLPWRKGQQFLSGDVWQVPWVLPRTQKSGASDPDPAAMPGRGGSLSDHRSGCSSKGALSLREERGIVTAVTPAGARL